MKSRGWSMWVVVGREIKGVTSVTESWDRVDSCHAANTQPNFALAELQGREHDMPS